MPVLRQVIGETLRGLRMRQRRTLRDVSTRARVSLGYLSEVERGQKEASSELLAAICGALDVELSELFWEVSDTLRRQEKRALVAKVAAMPGTVGAGLATAVPAGTARIAAMPPAAAGPQLRAGVAA
ncbi:MAG TPA: helix-turn-helix transcriptional regulator [Jatrophihabitantaceae bacterium]|jgi:transcriptional regulator with XRE-family HTH domain